MRKTISTMFKSMIINLLVIAMLFSGFQAIAQKAKAKKESARQEAKSDTLKSSTFGGLKWRSIGPSFTSGRIADFAVNPNNHNEWYVAVASGHVWKTINNGTTLDRKSVV